MKTQFLITLRDKDGRLFYLLAPRGPWTTWGAKAEAQRFPSKAAAERRRRTIGRNRDPRDRLEIAPL